MDEPTKQAIVLMLQGVLNALGQGQRSSTVKLGDANQGLPRNTEAMGIVTDMCTRLGFTITWAPGDDVPATIDFPEPLQ